MTGEAEKQTSGPPTAALHKVPTGIQGLDEILHGGVPQGRTTLICGGPGTGKTVLSLEFAYRRALAGEPGIFFSFEERSEVLRRNAKAVGWDLETLEQDGKLKLIQPDLPEKIVASGQFDITGMLAILEGQAQELGAQRIVIDAADILFRLFRSADDREDQLFALHDWLDRRARTAVLTLKSSGCQGQAHDRLEFLSDCVLHLDNRVVGQITTRRLRVLKYRGSGYRSNEFPFLISDGGVTLMPVTRAEPSQKFGATVTTGNRALDPLLDGGLPSGACVLVAGGTGTGKTTFASQFAIAAAERQERVLYINFEEGVESFEQSMRSPGIELSPHIRAERIKVVDAMPESAGSEEHLLRFFRICDRFRPAHVVVDAISACERWGSEEIAFDFLMRLLAHCRSIGATCLFLNQTDPQKSQHWISGVGISSLVDVLILLEQDWPEDRHRRRLLIVKARGVHHSHDFHRFRITDHGIRLDSGQNLRQPEGSP